MPKAHSSRYLTVSRKKADFEKPNPYWPLAAGTIVMLLAVAVVNHSGWSGHKSDVTTFRITFKHEAGESEAFRPNYRELVQKVIMNWTFEDPNQDLTSLQYRVMQLGHFSSTTVTINSPGELGIFVTTGPRVFDFEHQQTNHAHEVAGLRPLPEETEALGLPKLETTTSAGFLSALEIFRHAQVQGWSAHIQEIREPKPNQLEFVVLDESGTHGTVDFRSTPSHEASTEPIFALKLKILDKQAMVYRSLTPGGGQWRIEPRGMVRRPST